MHKGPGVYRTRRSQCLSRAAGREREDRAKGRVSGQMRTLGFM